MTDAPRTPTTADAAWEALQAELAHRLPPAVYGKAAYVLGEHRPLIEAALRAELEAVARNVLIHDDEDVAVPREDYDALQAALALEDKL